MKTGSKSKKISKDPLVGMFFHSLKDDVVNWQGHIEKKVKDELYMVLTFDWLMGEVHDRKLVSIDEMKGWIFYPSGDSMRHSYEYGAARSHRSDIRAEAEEHKKAFEVK